MPSFLDRLEAWTPEATAKTIGAYLGTEAQLLSKEELGRYDARRRIRCGWQIKVAFGKTTKRLHVLLTAFAPLRPPLIALADPPPSLTWPHVEDDGVLCLAPESNAVDWARPVDVLTKLLAEACMLIESCSDPLYCDAEFRREFHSYWERFTLRAGLAISLVRPTPPSRLVRVWHGKDLVLFSDDDRTIRNWLANRSDSKVKPDIQSGALIWLPAPMTPREFPRNGGDLKQVLRRSISGGNLLVSELLTENFSSIPLLLAANTADGACLAAVELRPPRTIFPQGRRDIMGDGFRPGQVPASVIASRAFSGSSAVTHLGIVRADFEWIHNRSGNPRIQDLNSMTVIIIGCGSLGGFVAVQLAMSGVAHFVLCDPDTLTWANTGRHVLGANYVGSNKAEALAKELRARFNHVTVQPYAARWQEISNWQSLAESATAIVSVTGDWAAEAALNVQMATGASVKPVIYGWTEPYACAGQAIAVLPGQGCLQCGFASDGRPKVELTSWSGKTTRQEPGCGTTFQPYGPIELSHSASLTSELTLDCLLATTGGSSYRAWFGASQRLQDLGGEWNAAGIRRFGDPGPGERVLRSRWDSDAACPVCGNA
jgi:molybdopterin/thiamine biosynthesis adenylyltransferase